MTAAPVARGSGITNVPQEGVATGEAQPAKHPCFVTEAASPTQVAADPPLHQASVPGTQQRVLSDTMLKVWWGEVGNADSEKGRLRRNPEIKSYIRSMLSSAISAEVFFIFIKTRPAFILWFSHSFTTGQDGFTQASHDNPLSHSCPVNGFFSSEWNTSMGGSFISYIGKHRAWKSPYLSKTQDFHHIMDQWQP